MSELIKVTTKIDDAKALAAFAKAPARMRQLVGDAVMRGAQEVVVMAREKAPKLFSNLTNSINATKVNELHWKVKPGVNYARAVEEGSGPAAGRPRYYPNPDSLRQYIMGSPRVRGYSFARAGSRKRGEQELDIWFRSRAMAWYIYNHGTKAQPFMKPAAEAKESRVIELIRDAVFKGAMEVLV